MRLKLKKREDPKRVGKQMTVIQQGFNCKFKDKDNMYIVGNAVGRMYTVKIRQEQAVCNIKYVPITLRGLIKAMYNKYHLRGGLSPSCAKCCDGDVENDGSKNATIMAL